MCIVKMPLKVYRIQRVFRSKPIFFFVKESETQEENHIYFNVYGIMIFFVETALLY